MKRGELWTVSGGADFTGKPRPALIIQDHHFDDLDSIVICPLTASGTDASYFRPALMPNDRNMLSQPSRVMVDKIASVRKTKLGKYVGRLDRHDMARVDRALIVFLGVAGSIIAGPDND